MTEITSNDKSALTAPERLRALADSALMDSPPEAVFERAVRLATRILGTEVGLLSLVDGERQFFKAQRGLPEPVASKRETPLSHSFCQHVVISDAPLQVGDAREDARLKDNLAIPDLGVIAYLGVPVHSPDGETLGSLCAIQDQPRVWTEEDKALLEDIAAGIESELALRSLFRKRDADAQAHAAVRDRLDLALKSGGFGTYDLDLTTGLATWDAELYALWGISPDTEDPFEAAVARIHPDDLPTHQSAFDASCDPSGNGLYAAELRILQSGQEDERWVSSTGIVTFEGTVPVRMVGTVRDISDRKRAEEHARLLAEELNHRVKNLFAITNGLVAITAKESETPQQMAQALRSRIVSLSAAHDLVRPAITRDQSSAAQTDFQTLASIILGPHLISEEQISLSGPSIVLDPKRASSLALVLHELATNAGKYGALSRRDGRIKLAWRLEDETLAIDWRETGGPSVKQPTEQGGGFGSTLIDLTIRRQLFGDYEINWQTNGVECLIRLPWKKSGKHFG